jgi:hypothetical protein
VGEVGAVAWALPEYTIIDSSGINSPRVRELRAADRERLDTLGAKPADEGSDEWVRQVLREFEPDWIVSLPRFLHLYGLSVEKDFQYRVERQERIYPGQPVWVLRRIGPEDKESPARR